MGPFCLWQCLGKQLESVVLLWSFSWVQNCLVVLVFLSRPGLVVLVLFVVFLLSLSCRCCLAVLVFLLLSFCLVVIESECILNWKTQILTCSLHGVEEISIDCGFRSRPNPIQSISPLRELSAATVILLSNRFSDRLTFFTQTHLKWCAIYWNCTEIINKRESANFPPYLKEN